MKLRTKRIFKASGGLTLLELLIVAAVLVVLAGSVITALDKTEEDSAAKIAQSEILEIRKAALQFKQDTGYLPKQGPFALGIDCSFPDNPIEERFCSPGNFEQLYEAPDIPAGNPQEYLETWNPNTARGWRGPYLKRHGEGLVDIGDGLNTDGSGSPAAGTILPEIRSAADPFIASPAGSYFVWRTTSGGESHARWGRPYLMFDLNNNNARIVSMGPNGIYDGGADDIIIEILR